MPRAPPIFACLSASFERSVRGTANQFRVAADSIIRIGAAPMQNSRFRVCGVVPQ